MNKWDVILGFVLLVIVILAIVHSVRVRKRGGCSCGCGGCTQRDISCTEKKKT